jgi:hypothetical protein
MPDRFIDPPLFRSPFVPERLEGDDRNSGPRGGGSSKRRASSVSALLMALVACLGIGIMAAPAAQADTDFQCNFTLPAGTYEGNIVVPPGQDCFLTHVIVHGNVKALADSQLNIHDSTIYGNVEGDKADAVNVNISTVHGNISAKEGGPALRPGLLNCDLAPPFDNPCEFQVQGTTVVNGNIQATKMTGSVATISNDIQKGNVQFVDNNIIAAAPSGDVEILFIWSNFPRIAGDLQVFKNTGPGPKFVFQNPVEGVIQCYENDPPFLGGPNFGRAPDQPPPLMSGKNQCFGTST